MRQQRDLDAVMKGILDREPSQMGRNAEDELLASVALHPQALRKALSEGFLGAGARLPRPGLGPNALPGDAAKLAKVQPPELLPHIYQRLREKGFISRDGVLKTGLSVDPDVFVAFLARVLDYPAARDAAGLGRRFDSLGGVAFEAMLPFRKEVLDCERLAGRTAVRAAVERRAAARGLPRAAADEAYKRVGDAFETHHASGRAEVDVTSPYALLTSEGRLGEGLFDIRLTGIRDEDGRLVTDHFRAILDVGPPAGLTVYSVGESKFKSGTREIAAQVIRSFERVQGGVHAPELRGIEVGPRAVHLAPEVVAVVQTEKPAPRSHLAGLAQQIRSTSAHPGAPDTVVRVVEVVDLDGAKLARDIIRALIRVEKP
jgi:hypothetical protein